MKSSEKITAIVLAFILIGMIAFVTVKFVPEGTKGIVYSDDLTFQRVLEPGIHLTWPTDVVKVNNEDQVGADSFILNGSVQIHSGETLHYSYEGRASISFDDAVAYLKVHPKLAEFTGDASRDVAYQIGHNIRCKYGDGNDNPAPLMLTYAEDNGLSAYTSLRVWVIPQQLGDVSSQRNRGLADGPCGMTAW